MAIAETVNEAALANGWLKGDPLANGGSVEKKKARESERRRRRRKQKKNKSAAADGGGDESEGGDPDDKENTEPRNGVFVCLLTQIGHF